MSTMSEIEELQPVTVEAAERIRAALDSPHVG